MLIQVVFDANTAVKQSIAEHLRGQITIHPLFRVHGYITSLTHLI